MSSQKVGTQQRRRQIAVAALEVVAQQGWPGLTMAAVAAKVGLVPSALYRHFRGKEQIVDAILALVREQLLINVRLTADETPNPLARLHRLLQLHLQFILDHPGLLRVVFSDEVMGGPPARRAQVYDLVQAYLQEVAGLIRQGQGLGSIRPDLSPERAAVAFLGLLQPAVLLWHLSGGQLAVPSIVEQAWQIFAAGLAVPLNRPTESTYETP